MNEREKKAVERIEDTFYSDLGKGINKFQKITLYEDGIRDVRILLNLLEKLQKENEELRIKNNAIKKESEAYAENLIRLDNELNQENKKCMILAIEKQDYFEKYRYHLQQNESLTKEYFTRIARKRGVSYELGRKESC